MKFTERVNYLFRSRRLARFAERQADAERRWWEGIISDLDSEYSGDPISVGLKVPPIFCATTFLSQTLGDLPLSIYIEENKRLKEVEHPYSEILTEEPDDGWNAFEWVQQFIFNVVTSGTGAALILRRGKQVDGLQLIPPNEFQIELSDRGRKVYTYNGEKLNSRDVLSVRYASRMSSENLQKLSPFHCKDSVMICAALEKYAYRYFKNGGLPLAVLESPAPTADALIKQRKQLGEAIKKAFAEGAPILPLPPDHKLTALGYNPEQSQFLEARKYQVIECARMFNIPITFLHDLSFGTYSNVEQQDISLTKHCVSNIASATESEFSLKLFGRGSQYRIKFDFDSLLRGDTKTRIEAQVRQVQGGIMTPNEARRMNHLPDHPGGEQLYIQKNMDPLKDAGKDEDNPKKEGEDEEDNGKEN